LSDFRIRGLSREYPLISNVLRHPIFSSRKMRHNRLHRSASELFTWKEPSDRAITLFNFLAEITVNGNIRCRRSLKAPAKPRSKGAA